MRRLFWSVLACAGALACVGADYEEVAAVSFGAYAPGEALGTKGAAGGGWSAESLSQAACVTAAARTGMALDGTVRFDVATGEMGNLSRTDFSLRVEPLEPGAPVETDVVGGFSPALIDGRAGYYAWGDGRWNGLFAAGAPPVPGTWLEGRFESKTLEGYRFVSYLVKAPSGEWVRCADVQGRTWFQAGAASARPSISFTGRGVFSDFAQAAAQEPLGPVFRWTGGAGGDWNDPANWSSNGVAAAGVPSEGSYAFITTPATLTNGTEQADVSFLAVADGRDVIGGDFAVPIALDVDRPRAGQALVPICGTFFGITPSYDFTWTRSDWRQASMSVVSHAAAFTPSAADYGHWFGFTAAQHGRTRREQTFYFSKLPVCYLTTADGKTPTAAKEVHAGRLRLQGNDAYKLQYDGEMTINVRGNSSRNYPKKPYKIKLAEKTKLFGFGKKNKHWVLLANYNDLSQTRNKLPYDFANAIGGRGMSSTWVDCILNGRLLGTYQLSEQIRVGEGRVDIYDWEAHAAAYGATETDLSAIDAALAVAPGTIDVTGGYLLEFSTEADEVTSFDVSAGSLVMHAMAKSPEFLNTSSALFGWCRGYLQRYFTAVTAWDGCSADGRHWSELCDVDSMVAFFLVNELFDNADMGQKSRYASIDRGGRLVWGPVWDFDWGSHSRTVEDRCERWRSAGGGEANMNREWTSDPWFCLKAYEKYWEIRDRYAAVYAPGGAFDQALAAVESSVRIDEAIWTPRTDTSGKNRTFDADVAILRTFHARRLAWMDRQFADVPTLMASLRNAHQTHAYVPDAAAIQPEIDDARGRFTLTAPSAVRVKAVLNGRVLGTFALKNGEAQGRFPADARVEGPNRRNCLALVAYDAAGQVCARNYALFPHLPRGFVLKLR